MSDDHVRRVSDALDAVERIQDREDRVRTQSQIMSEQVRRNKAWSQDRSALIRELWAEGDGLSYRQIAERLGIKLSTVQDVFRDYKGSGTTRPKKSSEE